MNPRGGIPADNNNRRFRRPLRPALDAKCEETVSKRPIGARPRTGAAGRAAGKNMLAAPAAWRLIIVANAINMS